MFLAQVDRYGGGHASRGTVGYKHNSWDSKGLRLIEMPQAQPASQKIEDRRREGPLGIETVMNGGSLVSGCAWKKMPDDTEDGTGSSTDLEGSALISRVLTVPAWCL